MHPTRVSRYSHELTARIDRAVVTEVFLAPRPRAWVSVSRTRTALRNANAVWQGTLFRDPGYLVSARAGRKEKEISRRNALECKPDPCEIRDPATVPPTTTADRTFRAIQPDPRSSERGPILPSVTFRKVVVSSILFWSLRQKSDAK